MQFANKKELEKIPQDERGIHKESSPRILSKKEWSVKDILLSLLSR